ARRRAEAEQARTAVDEGLAAREALCARVEAIEGDDAVRALDEARAAWTRLAPLTDERGAPLARRFHVACEACRARHEHLLARDRQRADLESVVTEAEALAAAEATPAAKARRAIDARWTAVSQAADASPDELATLVQRMAAARERLAARQAE